MPSEEVARATYTRYRPGGCSYRALNYPRGYDETDIDDPDCGPSEPINFRIDNVKLRSIADMASNRLAGKKRTTAMVQGTYTFDGVIHEFREKVRLRTDSGLWKIWSFEETI
jgi:hypothetical protein